MAQVVQCDVCNNVCKTNEATNVLAYSITPSYTRGKNLVNLDICPACFNRLKEVLKIDK